MSSPSPLISSTPSLFPAAAVAQDPVMFCGTIRDNLDPFGLADDVTLWAALEAARLSAYVAGLEGKLEAEVHTCSWSCFCFVSFGHHF